MKSYFFLLPLLIAPAIHASTILNLNWTDPNNPAGLPTSLSINLGSYQDEGPGVAGEFYGNINNPQASQVLISSDTIWALGSSSSYLILYDFNFPEPNVNLEDLAPGQTFSFSGSELFVDYPTGSTSAADFTGELTAQETELLQPLDAESGNTPEVGTILMMGSGLAVLGVAGRKLRKPRR